MSQMKELYEKVARDPELQAKFITILQETERDGMELSEQKLISLSKEAGFDVTLDEMQHYLQEMTPKADGELSDAELDLVAGGKGEGAVAITTGVANSIAIGITTLGFGAAACIFPVAVAITAETMSNIPGSKW